jgi:hypothetical protein
MKRDRKLDTEMFAIEGSLTEKKCKHCSWEQVHIEGSRIQDQEFGINPRTFLPSSYTGMTGGNS